MAPFTPFICEVMYQNLRRCLLPRQQGGQEAAAGSSSGQQQAAADVPESVHFCDMPALEQVG